MKRIGPPERGGLERVDVQVGEVALAQRDEVAVGAEVGLDRAPARPSRVTVNASGASPPAAVLPSSATS